MRQRRGQVVLIVDVALLVGDLEEGLLGLGQESDHPVAAAARAEHVEHARQFDDLVHVQLAVHVRVGQLERPLELLDECRSGRDVDCVQELYSQIKEWINTNNLKKDRKDVTKSERQVVRVVSKSSIQ